ncbi:MAG: class I SAM-dependent methyltransferase [Reyranella sp.]|nr:class I SAM-dependent methyltransferase [Reyranella sp.]
MDEEFEGYVTATPYTHVYYPESAPSRLQLATFNRSVPFPASRPLRYLELGYGNGISLNIHAAASPGEYWGTDINVAHAATANSLAAASGSGLKALASSFEELLERPDLPQFDVVVALGVWSWVSDANRKTIVELLRRKLVEGGIFCMSSIAMPGFGELAPFQHLLRLNLKRGGTGGTVFDKLASGLGLATVLQKAGSRFFAEGSRAGRMLDGIEAANPNYLVHEYLHEHWKPSFFAETASALGEAGLRFVGSERLLDQFDELNFGPEALDLLASIDDLWLRETARDFLRSGHVKGDVYVKRNEPGRSRPSSRPVLDLEFVLGVPASLAKMRRVRTPVAILEFGAPPFRNLIDALGAEPCRPKGLKELIDGCSPAQFDKEEVLRALMVLVDAEIVHPAQPRARIDEAAPACSRLNAEILRRSLTDDRIHALASPVTGGGVAVSRIQQLFLLALRQGAKSPDEWAKFAWDALAGSDAVHGVDRADGSPTRMDILKEALHFLQCLPQLAVLKLVEGGWVNCT